MHSFKKILVATDTRYDQSIVINEAAKIAKREDASLTIVDALPELSWAARVAMRDPDHVMELMLEERSTKLTEIVEALQKQDIKADSRVLRGHFSLELIRCVLRDGYDLLMRTNKGRDSKESGFFGRTSKQLLRKCPCPLWLMRDHGAGAYKNIMACVETSSENEVDKELNDLICKLAGKVSACHDTSYSVMHTWNMWNEQMLKSRMPDEEFEAMRKATEAEEVRLFKDCLERQGRSLEGDNNHLINGECWTAIPDFAKANDVDLVVIGTVGKSGLEGVLMGNTSERILNRVECDVLAVKPLGFHCPVRMST